MKRFLTTAAVLALLVGVTLPAAAINPFGGAPAAFADSADSMLALDADGAQSLEDAVVLSAAAGRGESFASEAKPKPKPPTFAVAVYTGPILDAWRGMMANLPVSGARLGVGFVAGHDGLDFLAASGTPIRATAAGTVVRIGVMGTMGDMVQINHGGGIQTIYGHMIHGSQTVKLGQVVEAGQVIGRVGQTGAATGPHCHYGVYANGRLVNPVPFLGL